MLNVCQNTTGLMAIFGFTAFSALTLLVEHQEEHLACKKIE